MSSRDSTENSTGYADISGNSKFETNNSGPKEGNSDGIDVDGLDLEEQYGLKLDERKRERSEAHYNVTQTRHLNNTNKDSIFSDADCVETSSHLMAKLTKQASQLQ